MGALCVMAIGAGAMTVSHANDSYFWVVTNFGGMTPEEGYKTQTAATLVEGICSIAFIFILSLFYIKINYQNSHGRAGFTGSGLWLS